MPNPSKTFYLSLEPISGPVRTYPCHLGTIESVAMCLAQEIFYCNKRFGALRTVALLRDGKIWDVFDGEWTSERE